MKKAGCKGHTKKEVEPDKQVNQSLKEVEEANELASKVKSCGLL